MKLILIRHAQSIRNLKHGGRTFYDVGEEKLGLPNYLIPLTEKGISQAQEAGKQLHEKWSMGEHSTPSVILHSGYERTCHTAEIFYDTMKSLANDSGIELDVPFEQNQLLRERDAGHAIEMDVHEAKTHFPYMDEHWNLDGRFFAVPAGGESIVQVMDRVQTFLLTLTNMKRLEGKTVYAVTHGGTMMAFEIAIKKIPYKEALESVHNPKNCEIVSYEYKEGEWKPF